MKSKLAGFQAKIRSICSAGKRMMLSFCSIIATKQEGCTVKLKNTNLTKGEQVSVCEAKLMMWKDKKDTCLKSTLYREH
jgi:hypothetical protein